MQLPWPVVLASASPRRQELLKKIVSEFTVDPAHLDEDALTDPDPWITAQKLAREKALAVRANHPDSLVIAGDTVVALPHGEGWIQLAKPVDAPHAEQMLAQLAGRTHTVITGIALACPTGFSAFTDSSKVTFRALSSQEIASYVATGEPMDKAGSYGLQGMAKEFIAQVEGSVTCVIGLPMERLEEALRSLVKK
jgi:septum formation protein